MLLLSSCWGNLYLDEKVSNLSASGFHAGSFFTSSIFVLSSLPSSGIIRLWNDADSCPRLLRIATNVFTVSGDRVQSLYAILPSPFEGMSGCCVCIGQGGKCCTMCGAKIAGMNKLISQHFSPQELQVSNISKAQSLGDKHSYDHAGPFASKQDNTHHRRKSNSSMFL